MVQNRFSSTVLLVCDFCPLKQTLFFEGAVLALNLFFFSIRYHIKALDALMEDLNDNPAALIANLDLILKWLTLRFFDTNPSVVFKGLEYLHSVFNVLMDSNYRMLENEASSFLPYLVIKVVLISFSF